MGTWGCERGWGQGGGTALGTGSMADRQMDGGTSNVESPSIGVSSQWDEPAAHSFPRTAPQCGPVCRAPQSCEQWV